MKNNTTKTQNFNFRDYMAMPSGMDFELLFDVLNDHGITVANTADDFLYALDEEDVIYEMDELGSEERRLAAKQAGKNVPRKTKDEELGLADWKEMNAVIGGELDALQRRWSGFTTR